MSQAQAQIQTGHTRHASHVQAGLIAQVRFGNATFKPILRWFGEPHYCSAAARDYRDGHYTAYENGNGAWTARRWFGHFHSISMKLSETCEEEGQALAICRRHQMDMLADSRTAYAIQKEDKENRYEYNEAVDGVGRHLDTGTR